ncbi:MAG TPA: fumarylacetoacetate hydrolase family protein [Longimicrobiales bacterium]|nr:fumarylacetoacetate hydrolase family protein [Longimicrobiales bacterium]
MKLFRYGDPGRERPGVVLPEGRRVDVTEIVGDYDESFFAGDGIVRLREAISNASDGLGPEVPEGVRLGPPIARPGKILCIGLNYRDHAAETGAEPPAEPVVFMKATSALSGPDDDLILPRGSEHTDWEVELAFVIGKRASYVDEADAMEHVAGYVLHNDVSERHFQRERGGQWVKGKSCDTFAPLGPMLVTRDEVPAWDRLDVWLRLNGETMQQGNTSAMIFGVPFLVSYLSRFMSLLPGDVVSTGTPAGVGLGRKPPRFLVDGDVLEYGIEGLGSARKRVRASGR